ncbi:MAG: Uma2 family endonuclease, partial [Cyanobacteria bacterium J06626_18]
GPDIVIELISESTAAQDKTETKEIYQKQLRVPEYFWFDPFNPDDLAGFSLDRGIYQPIQPDNQGHLISQQLDLKLVRWQGVFKAVETTWLRWRTLDGILLPTDREQASAAKQQVNAERQRADAEQQRADRLAERLRSLGVNPEDL